MEGCQKSTGRFQIGKLLQKGILIQGLMIPFIEKEYIYLFLWNINNHARKFMIENWNLLSDEALEKQIEARFDDQYAKISEMLRKREV